MRIATAVENETREMDTAMMVPFQQAASPVRLAAAESARREAGTRDPLNSPMWNDMAKRYLGGKPYVFDERVRLSLPHVTEDQTQVPIGVDARELGRADEIVLIVDLHPFPRVLRVQPLAASAFVAYRQKIEQGTPIRAAVRQGDLWYVGGRYLDAAGGGCSVPPAIVKKIDWDHIGQTRGCVWREADGRLRLRLRLLHPMDNGMMANIPAYFIETLDVSDAAGNPLAKLELSEAVAENPTLTLMTDPPKDGDVLKIVARDNNGGLFKSVVPIPPAPAGHVREGRL